MLFPENIFQCIQTNVFDEDVKEIKAILGFQLLVLSRMNKGSLPSKITINRDGKSIANTEDLGSSNYCRLLKYFQSNRLLCLLCDI